MSLLTYTENASSLYTGYYGSSGGWRDGNVAYQGRWTGSGTKAQRIGLVFFKDLVTNMSGKVIKSISITCKIGGAGTSSSKTMRCWSSNYGSYDSTKLPQSYLNQKLQDFTVPSHNQTYTFSFEDDAVSKLAAAIKSENGAIAIYLPESEDSSSSAGSYSVNYLQVDSVTITVQYYNGTVKIYVDNQWKDAIPYIYVDNTNKWKQAIPYVYINNTDKWKISTG